MNSRSAVKLLLVLVLGLPVMMAVLGWVAGLLTAMEDATASIVLKQFSLGASVLWLLCVVGLVVAMAVESLDEP